MHSDNTTPTPEVSHPDPIDAVIAWVNGDDPLHREKRYRFMDKRPGADADDIGGDTRFRALGELKWSVASLNRFAPFIRRIYIVTDNQNPDLEDFLAANFDNPIPVEIVDHRDIFKDYECVLPTFNSLTIETMTWKIPGLAERFVYLNDDFILISPVSEKDWFDEGSLVCHASRFNAWFAAALRFMKPRKGNHKPFGFKDAMLNAADVTGKNHFWYFGHAPHPQFKSILSEFFESNTAIMEENIAHRFRHPDQFNTQELCYLLAEDRGQLKIRDKKHLAFLKPTADRPGYIESRLKRIDSRSDIKFLCINSLDLAPEADRQHFIDWITRRLHLQQP